MVFSSRGSSPNAFGLRILSGGCLMVPDTSRWRSEAAYDYLDTIPAGGIAWEYLRRNGLYQRDYTLISSKGQESRSAEQLLERRWALRFRRTTRSQLGAATRHLDVPGP